MTRIAILLLGSLMMATGLAIAIGPGAAARRLGGGSDDGSNHRHYGARGVGGLRYARRMI
jgi:hypothetical protein